MKKNITITLLILFFNISYSQISDSVNYAYNLIHNNADLAKANRILLKYKDSLMSDTSEIKLYTKLAISYGKLRQVNQAMDYANEALKLSSSRRNNFYRVEIENTLGFIHQLLGDYKQAAYHKKQVLGKSDFTFGDLGAYRELIRCYLLFSKDSANYYAKEAILKYDSIKLKDSISKKVLYEIKIFEEVTGLYRPKELINLYKNGIKIGVLPNNGKNNILIGAYYEEIKENDSAIYYYEKTINKSSIEKDTSSIVMSYQRLIVLYEATKQADKKEDAILAAYSYKKEIERINQETYRDFILQYEKLIATKKSYFIYYLLIFIGVMFFIIFLILKKGKGKKTETTSINLSDSVIQKINRQIIEIEKNKEYLNPDFTLSLLESKIKINRKYITEYFKEIKKSSFTTYINKLRVSYAEERLKDSNDNFSKYSIENMAKESGYKTSRTFLKYFNLYSNTKLSE